MEYTIENSSEEKKKHYDFLIRFTNGSPLYFQFNQNSLVICQGEKDEDKQPYGNIKIPSEIKYNGQLYNVKKIGDYAFANCKQLHQLEIPESIHEIGECVFVGTSLKIMNHSSNYTLIEGALYTSDKQKLVYVPHDRDNFEIPLSVQKIGSGAFAFCTLLTQLDIPNSVKEIGYVAFGGCSSLQYIKLPNKIQKIPYYAFMECSSLQQIEIPNSVIEIEQGAFAGCLLLNHIKFSESLLRIGRFSFYKCSALQTIELPKSVQSLEKYAFQMCNSLKKVIVYNKDIIFYNDFDPDDGLSYDTSNTFPTNTDVVYRQVSEYVLEKSPSELNTMINYLAHYGNSFLIRFKNGSPLYFETEKYSNFISICGKRIDHSRGSIYDHWTYYEDDDEKPFGSINVPSIIIDDGTSYTVSNIGNAAFSNCKELQMITLPDTIIGIYDSAFENCSSLQQIEIPSSVTRIGNGAFAGTSIKIINHSPNFVVENGALYTSDKTELLYVPNDKTDFEIPNTIEIIRDRAFEGCKYIKSIKLPKWIKLIEYNAFKDCTSLDKVYFPNQIWMQSDDKVTCRHNAFPPHTKQIHNDQYNDIKIYLESGSPLYFRFCIDKDEVAVCPTKSCKYGIVGYGEDDEKPFGEIKIPSSITYNEHVYNVTEIDDKAFSGCHDIKSINIPNSIRKIGSAFIEGTSIKQIDIPHTVKYITCHAFCNPPMHEINLPKVITEIPDGVFMHDTTLQRITIPETIRYIREEAFFNCTNLRHVDLTNAIILIEDNAFSNCYELTHIDLSSATYIGKSAFECCTSLQQAILSTIEYTISERTFFNCTNLQKVEIAIGVTEIEEFAFCFCKSLKYVKLPNTIKYIGNAVFGMCTSLEQIEIPSSVTRIGNGAFAGTSIKIINHSPNFVVENGALYTSDKTELLYVPNDKTDFEIPNTVEIIRDYAFMGCKFLKCIRIPMSVIRIGNSAFNGCDGLKEVFILNHNVEYVTDDTPSFPSHIIIKCKD